MKPLFTIVAFCFLSLMASATQRTVNNINNLPGNPGQFATIPAALLASNAGDTILVAGSLINYSAPINISQKVVLLGPGYNPAKQNPLTAIISGAISFTANNASGSVIMGFTINSNINFNTGTNINGAIIRRNLISSSIVFGDSTTNTVVAENSITGGYMYMATANGQNNLTIENNIFSSSSFSFYYQYNNTTNTSPVKVTHNLFINGSSTLPLKSSNINNFADISATAAYNLVIENNIFYNVSPAPVGGNPFINCTFDNNISYAGTALPSLPISGNGNVGSGNLNNTNPMMASLFNTANSIDYNLDNLRLQAGSPCIGTATDHSNIGPTGGAYPIYVTTNQYLTGEPPIPEVKSANFLGASSVSPGGTLQIQVKAQTIN